MLLRYDVKNWDRYAQSIDPRHIHQSGPEKPAGKYFVYTGSTDWGVQNLEYDAESGLMYMASYRGFKEGWPRYTMFALDIKEKPHKTILQGVEPKTKAATLRLLPTGKQSPDGKAWGWENTKGSTGITSLGNGLFYLSEDGYDKDQQSYYTNLRLYKWTNAQGFKTQQ